MTNMTNNKEKKQQALRAEMPEAGRTQEHVGADRASRIASSRARLSTRPWWELANLLASAIRWTTQSCIVLALPIAEIKALWLWHSEVFSVVKELHDKWRADPVETKRLNSIWQSIDRQLRDKGVVSAEARTRNIIRMDDWYHTAEMRQLQAAIQGFAKALHGRDQTSAQARYAEARLSSRRALMVGHNPVLDGCKELVETLRKVCSGEVAAYMTEDIRLDHEQFLDLLHMLAYDRADPATVPNPPARILAALSREQRRKERLNRERWMPPTQAQADGQIDEVETGTLADVDWDRAKRELGLPPDQTRAVEARMEGSSLQASDGADLGWDASRVERIRRSLEPDRRWGRKLRRRLSAYAPPERTVKTKPKKVS